MKMALRCGVVLLLFFGTCATKGVRRLEKNWDKTLKAVEEEGSNSDDVFFEGDIIMPRKRVKEAANGNIEAKKVARGEAGGMVSAITAPLSWRWAKGVVPYEIANGLGGRKAIRSAMKEWSQKTCIVFRPKRRNDRHYVTFKSSKWGHCASHIGRTGGQQFVYLGLGCRSKGIVLHEIGHTLGFFHEQSRPDRDQYVDVQWDNIHTKHHHNFLKYNTGRKISDMGIGYDYDSIMHYGSREFVKWYKKWMFWKKSIKVKGRKRQKIGQRRRLSKLDVKEMNAYYKCPRRN